MSEYKPHELDKKWQARWTDSRAFEVELDPRRPKFYCLEMFAYPSGYTGPLERLVDVASRLC